jgi:hypothetical protein
MQKIQRTTKTFAEEMHRALEITFEVGVEEAFSIVKSPE